MENPRTSPLMPLTIACHYDNRMFYSYDFESNRNINDCFTEIIVGQSVWCSGWIRIKKVQHTFSVGKSIYIIEDVS